MERIGSGKETVAPLRSHHGDVLSSTILCSPSQADFESSIFDLKYFVFPPSQLLTQLKYLSSFIIRLYELLITLLCCTLCGSLSIVVQDIVLDVVLL